MKSLTITFTLTCIFLSLTSCSKPSAQSTNLNANSNTAKASDTAPQLPDEMYGKPVLRLTEEESNKVSAIFKELVANNEASTVAQKRTESAKALAETAMLLGKSITLEQKRLAILANTGWQAGIHEQGRVIGRNIVLHMEWLKLMDELLSKYNVSVSDYYLDPDTLAILPRYSATKTQ